MTPLQLVEAYVKARVGMVEACIRGDVEEDDLEVPDRIEEQLEQLPGICRSVVDAENWRRPVLPGLD